MSSIHIGPALIGDAPGIAAMSRTLIETGLPWSWTPRRVAAHMRDRESMVVTAKLERELVGFALAKFGSETVHLTLLGVSPAQQREGVGRRLMAWMEESAVVAGIFTVTLEVRIGNQAARRFYTALGYTERETVRGYYSGLDDAMRLTRDLRVRTLSN